MKRLLLLVAYVCNGAEYYLGADGVKLPDPQVTPGAADPKVTQANLQRTICRSRYTATVRDVPPRLKQQVLVEYGLEPADSSKVEIDHLVSLELGGANRVANLWPQPYETPGSPPGARAKDVLETHLKREVCAGHIPLAEAQKRIAMNWYVAYRSMKSEEAAPRSNP